MIFTDTDNAATHPSKGASNLVTAKSTTIATSLISAPGWVTWLLCLCFAILFGVWALPETILIRYTCLITGALLGLYVIAINWRALLTRSALPIWLILALFGWASIQLLFWGTNPELQLDEFSGIWKRAAIGCLFALGLGLALASRKSPKPQQGHQGEAAAKPMPRAGAMARAADDTLGSSVNHVRAPSRSHPRAQLPACLLTDPYWRLIYLGLALPTLIYLLKYGLSYLPIARVPGPSPAIPAMLGLYGASAGAFYIAKTVYVAFCLPLLAVALGQIAHQFAHQIAYQFAHQFGQQTERPQVPWWATPIYVLSCAAVLFVFYAENIKNGAAYALILGLIFVGSVLLQYVRNALHRRYPRPNAALRTGSTLGQAGPAIAKAGRRPSPLNTLGALALKLALSLGILAALAWFAADHLQKNASWRSLVADTKIALQTERYPHWKVDGEGGLPINEDGKTVSGTNYMRVAWALAGAQLLADNPLGYGLVERSFGHLAKIRWPDSKLHQSHSGWLDLALGIGLPGMALLLSSVLITLGGSIKAARAQTPSNPSANFGAWLLLSLGLLWCTTEVSQKVYLEELLFAIVWVAALGLGRKSLQYL